MTVALLTQPDGLAPALSPRSAAAADRGSVQGLAAPESRSADARTSTASPCTPTPEQLALRCQTGCRESFAALVELYQARIFNYLLQLTGHQQDAEDLAQETFIKAYRNLGNYSPAYGFTTWLFTIAKRTAWSHLRSQRSSLELSSDGEAETLHEAGNPAQNLEEKDAAASLWAQARRLRPRQFEVLWLRYAESFSVAEIARIMGTNSIHVKVLLHRGRNELAKRLGTDKAAWTES